MTTPLALPTTQPRRVGRSTLAILAALVANAGLATATDHVFHTLEVYPAYGQPMHEPRLFALALAYRLVYGAVAGVVVARLAPRAPLTHARVLGLIGTVLSVLGAAAALTQQGLGPAWYPIALVVTAYPSVLVGAAWQARRASAPGRA